MIILSIAGFILTGIAIVIAALATNKLSKFTDEQMWTNREQDEFEARKKNAELLKRGGTIK